VSQEVLVKQTKLLHEPDTEVIRRSRATDLLVSREVQWEWPASQEHKPVKGGEGQDNWPTHLEREGENDRSTLADVA